MDKMSFMQILQSALFNFDGMEEPELIRNGVNPKCARIGIKLCSYLKSKEIETERKEKDAEGFN